MQVERHLDLDIVQMAEVLHLVTVEEEAELVYIVEAMEVMGGTKFLMVRNIMLAILQLVQMELEVEVEAEV